MRLEPGADFRAPELRREVWHQFYQFHLEHRSHPGGVYYLLPWLRERLGWDDEEALWFAFLNGCTQHPPTSLLLWRQARRPNQARRMLAFYEANFDRLRVDTDRRHHKSMFRVAVEGYQRQIRRAGSQAAYWTAAATDGWRGVWRAATAIPSFGRLSAFSYSEYLQIVGYGAPCDDLMLGDISGSKSHRNGLAKVLGHDELDWHQSNPDFDGRYDPETIEWLTAEAATLLEEARARAAGKPWAGDVGYHTLESALCTYKSWHRKNRRYPNVYNDMLYDRLKQTERQWGPESTALFWEARAETQPAHLLLEATPTDPGCVPLKQNWYRETGQPIVMWAGTALESDFDRGVREGRWGERAR